MSYIYRAQTYVRRQWGRTLVLFLILSVIANITLAALSVQKGSEAAQKNLLNQAQSTVVYTTNQRQIMTARQDGTLAQDTDLSTLSGISTYGNYLNIIDTSYLSYADSTAVYEVTSETVSPYVNEQQANNAQMPGNNGQAPGGNGPGGGERPDGFVIGDYESAGDFTLNTYTNTTPLAFNSGSLELTDGRTATQDEIDSGALVVVIHETLATENSLSVGDSIELTPTIDGYETTVKYEVIGIYTSNETEDSRFSFQANSSLLTQNQMYVPFNTLKTVGLGDEALNAYEISTAEFTLNDPGEADNFIAEASAKVDLTYSTLSANTQEFERLSTSLTSVSSMSVTMIVIILVAAIVILTLIYTLSVNQRKNEIGVLLALGERKVNIVLQLITETLAIAVVAFLLSSFTFSLFTDRITQFASTNQSLISEVTDSGRGSERPQGDMSGGPGFSFGVQGSSNSSDDVSSQIDASLSLGTLSQFLLLGLGLCVVSTTLPAIIVMRYNPKKILSQN